MVLRQCIFSSSFVNSDIIVGCVITKMDVILSMLGLHMLSKKKVMETFCFPPTLECQYL